MLGQSDRACLCRALRAAALILVALPAMVASQRADSLSDWMQELIIPIPAGTSFMLPAVGNLELESGHCENLTIGGVEAIDNSSDLDLELGISLRGVGVSCILNANSSGSLKIDITLANSSFAVAAKMSPWFPENSPDLALPLGGLNMTMCSLHLDVTYANFTGDSPTAALAASLPPETLRSLMGQFVQEPVCGIVKDIVNVNGTAAFAEGTAFLQPLLSPPRALPTPRVLAPTLDMGRFPPIMVIQDLINTRFPLWAGRYLQVLAVPLHKKVFGSENVTLSMRDFRILGRAPDISPGLTIDANQTRLDMVANLEDLEFSGVLVINASLPDQPTDLIENIKISFGLSDLNLGANIYINEREYREREEDHDLSGLSCYVDCARSATDPEDASIAIAEMAVALEPGTHIEVAGAKDPLEEDATAAVNTIIRALQASYLPAISALINGGLGMARGVVNDLIWDMLDQRRPCNETEDGIKEEALDALWIAACVVAVVGVLVAILTPCSRRARSFKSRGGSKDETSSSEGSEVGASSSDSGSSGSAASSPRRDPQEIEQETNAAPRQDSKAPKADGVQAAVQAIQAADVSTSSSGAMGYDVCLAMHPNVPVWLTVSYPVFLLAICCLFLYADLALGAMVNVKFTAGGETEVLGPLFSFSLINTIAHSWSAGAYLIAILTLLMSGVWPFVKLALLTISWLTPPRLLTEESRGRILSVLDLCGKYSFLDSWFLVLTVSAFGLDWAGSGTLMKVEVHPTAAFYSFVIATSLSLVLGHVASEFHRHGLRAQKRCACPASQEAALQEPARLTSARGQSTPLSHFATRRARWVISNALLATAVLALIASFMISFQFEFGGLAPQVLDVENTAYSLISVATSLPEAGSGQGLVWLEVLFLLLTMALPLLLMALHLVLWLAPLPARTQDVLLYSAHVLDCWASMDVAALTLTIEALELGHLTEFLIASNGLARPCKVIKDLTKEGCFEVGIQLHAGFVALILAGLAMVVVPKVAHHYSARAIECRNSALKQSKSSLEAGDDASACGTSEV